MKNLLLTITIIERYQSEVIIILLCLQDALAQVLANPEIIINNNPPKEYYHILTIYSKFIVHQIILKSIQDFNDTCFILAQMF